MAPSPCLTWLAALGMIGEQASPVLASAKLHQRCVIAIRSPLRQSLRRLRLRLPLRPRFVCARWDLTDWRGFAVSGRGRYRNLFGSNVCGHSARLPTGQQGQRRWEAVRLRWASLPVFRCCSSFSDSTAFSDGSTPPAGCLAKSAGGLSEVTPSRFGMRNAAAAAEPDDTQDQRGHEPHAAPPFRPGGLPEVGLRRIRHRPNDDGRP